MHRSIFKAVAIMLVLAGAAFAGYSYLRVNKPLTYTQTQDVRVLSSVYVKNAQGVPTTLVQTVERIQKVNGDWQESTTYHDADGPAFTNVTVGIGGQGVYKIKQTDHTLGFIGERPAGYRPYFDPGKTTTYPGFVGTTTVAGQPVASYTSSVSDETYYRAINLDGLLLKIDSPSEIREANSVEFGTFTIPPLPSWPVDYADYQKQTDAYRQYDPVTADQMQKRIPAN